MRKGVVIGKFYPPHRGHKFLIDTAQSQVDDLTIIICDHPSQTIPASLRASWLREIHPRGHVVVTPDDLGDEDSAAWARRTIQILGGKPDVVFTSEDYGEPYSRAMSCEHVQVDKERASVPISGSEIRAHPLAHLDFLEPPVRAHFIPRICIVGAESTGKTTLAQLLAKHFDAEWIAEYGREYSERKISLPERSKGASAGSRWSSEAMATGERVYDGPTPKGSQNVPDYGEWTTDEFVHIATEQKRREEETARRAKRLIICDTDAFATGIWHERYMGFSSEDVNATGRDLNNRIYLVPDPSVTFVQDGLRDGEHVRDWMHRRFLEELEKSGRPFHVLSGSYEDRAERAIEIVESAQTLSFRTQ